MGKLIGGVWHIDDPAPFEANGQFKRPDSLLREPIPDGATAERLHLFVAWNCPWAHRALLVRTLLGLDAVTVSYALPRRTDQGWVFSDGADAILGARALHEVYTAGAEAYTGRATMPVLWDKPTARALNNESADIVRALGQHFAPGVLYPTDRADAIDSWNARIYPTLNNGVYRAGFASTQEAYDTAVAEVFETLDLIEHQLSQTRFLAGPALTEADIRLFPTLVRFDVAYHSAFKCNRSRIVDFPNLWGYARDIYQIPGVAQTVDFDIYRRGYHSPSPNRNPLGIVPVGPRNDWDVPHGRG